MANTTENFTIEGNDFVLEYKDTVDLQEVEDAYSGKIKLEAVNILNIDGNIKTTYKYYRFDNESMRAYISPRFQVLKEEVSTGKPLSSSDKNPVKTTGQDYVDWYNSPTGAVPFGSMVARRMANYMTNYMHGDKSSEFKVYLFDPDTLAFRQPVIFTCAQSNETETTADLTITATDFGGEISNLEYSIDGGNNYQASNVFAGQGLGEKHVFVKDENGTINSRKFTLTGLAI